METNNALNNSSLKENILTLIFVIIALFFFSLIPRISSPILFFFIVFLASISIIFALSLKGFIEDIQRFHTKDEAIKYCSEIAKAARNDYFSLGGECNAEFYENKAIIENLTNLIGQKVRIRILFGPNYDIRSINLLKTALEHRDQIEVKRLKRRYKGDHFKVTDEEYIHVGYSHPPLASEREGYIKRSKAAASKFKQIFEEHWKSAENFDIIEMVCKAKPIASQYLTEGWMERNDAEWGFSGGFITVDETNSGSKYRSAIEGEIEHLIKALGIQCSR